MEVVGARHNVVPGTRSSSEVPGTDRCLAPDGFRDAIGARHRWVPPDVCLMRAPLHTAARDDCERLQWVSAAEICYARIDNPQRPFSPECRPWSGAPRSGIALRSAMARSERRACFIYPFK